MAAQLGYVVSCIFSLLVAIISITFTFLKHKKSYKKSKKLPPGQMGLPWIGETMEFYKAQRKNQLFEEFFQPRITKYGKIFKTRLMGSPTVVVNGADANRFFLSNEFKLVISSWPSSSVQLMGKDSIMEKQGERHRCLRGLIGTSLGYAGLEALVPKVCNSVQLHLKTKWHGQEKVSLYRSTKVLTFSIVFECLLGIKVEPGMLATFERVLEGVFAPPIRFPGSKFSRARKARLEIEKMLISAVREKKKETEGRLEGGEEDGLLMSRLVSGMIKGEISEEEVVDNIVLLVFAAHDTTSYAIAMTFKMLAQHPNCYALLLQEHVDIMINKIPGENLTLEDMKKMKYTWQVLWTTYGTHYDEDYFQDPLSFNPSRFEEPIPPYVFLPFGGGPRVCAGYHLAKLNILIFVHFIVTHYDWSLLYPDEPITMNPLPFPSRGMPINISPKLL
ncbi:taxadiene 5-alpha hydroxylase [Quercus suber]|uniref:Taxadiene 5-alpha hydroxylase n=1 Tax=Quercus suber TaxID=58331 RepID=A0AAW0LPM0_QUESU